MFWRIQHIRSRVFLTLIILSFFFLETHLRCSFRNQAQECMSSRCQCHNQTSDSLQNPNLSVIADHEHLESSYAGEEEKPSNSRSMVTFLLMAYDINCNCTH